MPANLSDQRMPDAIPNYCATGLEATRLLKPIRPLGLSHPRIEVAVIGGIEGVAAATSSPEETATTPSSPCRSGLYSKSIRRTSATCVSSPDLLNGPNSKASSRSQVSAHSKQSCSVKPWPKANPTSSFQGSYTPNGAID